jgi:hypothetical protein
MFSFSKRRVGYDGSEQGARRTNSEREGLLQLDVLVREKQDILSDETILLLQKQEHDYLIARVGLQGTLWGAWACCAALVLIVVSSGFSSEHIVSGWQIVAIVGAMVLAIVYYGTFIFKRALNTSLNWKNGELSVGASEDIGLFDRARAVLQGKCRPDVSRQDVSDRPRTVANRS